MSVCMKKFLLFLLLGAAGAAAWFFVPGLRSSSPGEAARNAKAAPANPAAPGGRGADSAPVPVVAGEVLTKDVPLFLNGLGNVQGFNTVTVRSRVDGHLDRIEFTEGQEVKAGDVLARIDPRPYQAALDQVLARKKQDEALLHNARLDLKRDLTLLREKAGTAQKADTQNALVEQLEAALRADDAAIEAAQVQLEYTTLRSPINGRTGIRILDEGNVVRSGDNNGIVVVTQMRPISVVFTLSEQHFPAIQAQVAKGKLTVVALGRDNTTHAAEGTLTVVDNQIDSTTGTIRLKATFANEDLTLWPGQFVNVRLRLAVRAGATVVPASVIQRGPTGTYAYAIKSDETVELRPVKVSQFEDGLALIEEGLAAGERVVVDGQYRLQPGARVKIADPSGNRPKVADKATPKH